MPIPTYPPIRTSEHYRISPLILTTALQSIARTDRERKDRVFELRIPDVFPGYPLLQQLFSWLYCLCHGINERSANILERNATTILSEILKANAKSMDKKIPLEPDSIAWKESNEEIQQGRIFTITEEIFENWLGETRQDQTTFRVTASSNTVIFTQLVNDNLPGVIRDVCELPVSLDQLKNHCLPAFIDAEHRAGRIADLCDFDLCSLWNDRFSFDKTKIRASQFTELLKKRVDIDFTGLELCDFVKMNDQYFVHCKLDKPLALQLISMGADKRMVLVQYLKSEQARGRTKINLDGFDISSSIFDEDLRAWCATCATK